MKNNNKESSELIQIGVTEEEKWQLAIIHLVKQLADKNEGVHAYYEYGPWFKKKQHQIYLSQFHEGKLIWFIDSPGCDSAKNGYCWIIIECEKKGIRL